jgi:hypothetical protein
MVTKTADFFVNRAKLRHLHASNVVSHFLLATFTAVNNISYSRTVFVKKKTRL